MSVVPYGREEGYPACGGQREKIWDSGAFKTYAVLVNEREDSQEVQQYGDRTLAVKEKAG